MRFPYIVLALCLSFAMEPSVFSQALSAPACTVEKGYYQCDRAGFLAALKDAKTVAVESRPFDQATTNSLRKLARTLNKTVIASSPDLTFVLIRAQAEGIFYGPSDRELASFLVYAGGSEGADRQLVWIETYDGEPDLVWPIVVYDILRQFKRSIS
ncbi:MAG TPA: hypothetical protein VL498_00255 [Terracidiphilus sp.]|nr:hypothetical protein [Terracidiphilus sp.]